MKMYVGLTDSDWFDTLKQANYDEVNYWKPGGKTNFRALEEGDLFLFKLHSPRNYIVGGGFFLKFSILPSSLAWETFGIANGAVSMNNLTDRIYKYKHTNRITDPNPSIGCIILSMPFFFNEEHWISIPHNWSKNIVQGKLYDTTDHYGAMLYKQVQEKLHRQNTGKNVWQDNSIDGRHGEQIIKPRIGPSAFKVLIIDAYNRRCAITGEKTLPVLEATHIKPYSLNGPHEVNNGILLRRDFRALFDRGYLTIDEDLNVEVSRRIKEDFGNGREYYAHHGSKLIILPEKKEQLPERHYLEWHNENIYLG